MENTLKEKLEKVVELVNNDMVNPDIEITYCIPEVAETANECDISGDPYIEVTYIVNGTHSHKQKIRLMKKYLEKSAEDIANLVTFNIELFTSEIDSVEYSGA